MNQNARLIKQKKKIMNTFSGILATFQSVIIGGIIKTLQPWTNAPIVINACQPEWASPTAFVFAGDGIIQAHHFLSFSHAHLRTSHRLKVSGMNTGIYTYL